MRKENILLLILIIILSIFVCAFFISFTELKSFPVEFVKNNTGGNITENQIASSLQFYPNTRFNKKTISYHIDSLCSEEKKGRVFKAFEVLVNKTGLLSFYPETKIKADILISCNESEVQVDEEHFIVGEGGPTSIVNTSGFYIVEKGKILLLYERSICNNYNVELHELLHVFGFKHIKDKKSIMYEVTKCNQKFDDEIIDELIRLYSIDELPDLYFSRVVASKTNRYLDFNIEIRNKGLIKAENVRLELYNKGVKFESFSIGEIDYGGGKALDAKNVRLPSRNTKDLEFVIKSGNELNKKNNDVKLVLVN